VTGSGRFQVREKEKDMKLKSGMILLVEDEPDDEALTLRALQTNNVINQIFVVRDGEEALDFLFARNDYSDRDPNDLPKLILLDIKLPKMHGLEVLRQIRANPGTRLLPVVILTSSNEEQDLIEGYKSRVNSYIRKPVDFSQFVETIRELGLYWLGLNEEPPQ
jgi:two-component system response regulator